MEIIEFFQAFKNLADRTFRGRSLGYQDEYEPEVDVAERSNAWRMRMVLAPTQRVIVKESFSIIQRDRVRAHCAVAGADVSLKDDTQSRSDHWRRQVAFRGCA